MAAGGTEMPRFNSENVIDALELQQLVTDWSEELDANLGLNVTRFFTDDCIVEAGAISYRGHEAMKAFYRETAERGQAAHGGLGRTTRHAYANLGIAFQANDRAKVTFLSITFSGPGRPPSFDSATPVIVTDVRFECVRDANRDWRVAEFYGTPVFIGSDPFLNELMVK
jgi:hypothetical protein